MMKRLSIIFSLLFATTYASGFEQYKKEKEEFEEFLRYKKEKEKRMVFGGGYSNLFGLSRLKQPGRRYKSSDEWNGKVTFYKLDKMVGSLWCEINGRLVKSQTSGSQVANVFAELQRRCLIRKGKPVAFAIRLRDF